MVKVTGTYPDYYLLFENELMSSEKTVTVYNILGKQIANYFIGRTDKFRLCGLDDYSGLFFLVIQPNNIVIPIYL